MPGWTPATSSARCAVHHIKGCAMGPGCPAKPTNAYVYGIEYAVAICVSSTETWKYRANWSSSVSWPESVISIVALAGAVSGNVNVDVSGCAAPLIVPSENSG